MTSFLYTKYMQDYSCESIIFDSSSHAYALGARELGEALSVPLVMGEEPQLPPILELPPH